MSEVPLYGGACPCSRETPVERAALPARTPAGLGSRVKPLGFRVYDLRFWVRGSGFRIEDSVFRIYM